MSDGKISFFGAIARFFMFWKSQKALGINRAADSRFTDSEEGVGDAFDLAYKADKARYESFFSALSRVESAVEIKRTALANAMKGLATSTQQREGAMRSYEAAEAAHNQAGMDEDLQAAQRFQGDIDTKQAIVDGLKQQIAAHEGQLKTLEEQARQMQAKLQNADGDKAMAQADFVSAQMMKEANEKLMGIRAAVDESSPVDAVKKKIAAMTAEAQVSSRLAGADVRAVDDKYLKAGAAGAATDTVTAMLAARKAERLGTTGATTAAPVATTPASSDETPRRI